MNVRTASVLFTHLLALAGFLSIMVTGNVHAALALLFLAALVNSYLMEQHGLGFRASHAMLTALSLVVLGYVGVSVVILGMPFIKAIVSFLVLLQIIKLLGKKTPRDTVQIYLLSFFQFLAGTVLTVDFTYGVAFVVYVVIGVWAMMLLNMRSESPGETHPSRPGRERRIIGAPFLVTTFCFGLVIFLFTSIIFISVPRLGLRMFSSSFLTPKELRTGFSESVRLGRVGELKHDRSTVMRVKVLNLAKSELPMFMYWRGIALDEFDGTTWRTGPGPEHSIVSDRNGFVGLRKADKPAVQEIITEPLDSDLLFAATTPVGFKGFGSGRLKVVNDSYMVPSKSYARTKYLAYSDLHRPAPGLLRGSGTGYPAAVRERYLQLPETDARVGELVRTITFDRETPYDKVEGIMRYLLENLSYTLVLAEGTEAFPLTEFLFGSREGHCEYFATSMVIMLREIGIPARIVNGFLNGRWNEYGEFFLIRESDAHSWVEVFFPGYGWVSFDPTPGDLDPDAAGRSEPFYVAYLDYMSYRWNRYIIEFSQRDQVNILAGLRDKWRWNKTAAKSRLGLALKIDKRWAVGIAVFIGLAWIVITRVGIGGIGGFSWSRGREHPVTRSYRKALGFLARKGYTKSGGMTPLEFSELVISAGGLGYAPFRELTERYLALRFSDTMQHGEARVLDELLGRLKKEVVKAH